jgi:hypothetical protein
MGQPGAAHHYVRVRTVREKASAYLYVSQKTEGLHRCKPLFEFFLVQKGSDTLVVLETAGYGSRSTLRTATGDAAAVTSPDAAVITLTGVALADVAVNNGVIAHVA